MDIRFSNRVCYLCVCFASCLGFNIDTDKVLTFRGPEGSYFGYSAVMYSIGDQKWVVAGAPKANFTDGKSPEIKTPGNVFKCPINLTRNDQDDCEPMNLRQSKNSRWPDDNVNYEENNELLGASMTLIDNDIVTCAPQWKNTIPVRSSNFVHTIGRCFNVKKILDGTYTDGQFKNRDLPNTDDSEFALIGFSLPDNKYNGDPNYNIVIGAPGFDKDKGGFIQYTTDKTDAHFAGYILESIEGQLNGSIEIETLFGYSIATGTIQNTGDDCTEAVITGTPHYMMSEGIVGTVVITCVKGSNILFKQQFLGPQPAGGFGSALVFDDVNGDGLNDLLVGAPEQFDNIIDTGAVHVYTGLSNGATVLNKTGQVLEGNVVYGRFGTALKCIGDINKDGYSDVAVGAPYENNGQGSVYIYHGGPKLVFAQRIQARNIDTGLRSFGWFIGVSYDIDSNNFTDMIVGSYSSNIVTVLRSRPIITLNSSMDIYPKEIPLNSSGQDCQDDAFRPCVSVNICFSYDGIDVPDNILVGYKFFLDAERTKATPRKTSRVHLFHNRTDLGSNHVQQQNVSIQYGIEECINFSVIVEPVNREFYASLNEKLVIEMEYGLADKNIPGVVEPVLDRNNPTLAVDSANFSSGCEGSCKPNLQVITSASVQEVILGVKSEIVITVILTNHGEQSHSTWMVMTTPNNTLFITYYQPTDQATDIVDCKHIQASGYIQCDLRSLFYNKQNVIVNFRFFVSRETLVSVNETLGSFNQLVTFRTDARTTGVEADNSDNYDIYEINTRLYSVVEFTGASKPEQLRVSDNQDEHLYYVHTYSLLNKGPSPLYNSTIELCIPITNDTGIPLMDINDVQVISNNQFLSWEVIQFPGMVNDEVTNSSQRNTSTSPQQINLQLVENGGAGMVQIKCDTTDTKRLAIIRVNIKQLEKDEKDAFSITLNISEEALRFTKRDGIIYRTKAILQTRNDSRYFTTAVNASYEISSEIFPQLVEPEETKINLWIIVGGSVGGFVLLVILGIILWKCKFFERKTRDDVRKRRTMYLAEVQKRRTMALSTHVSNQTVQRLPIDNGS